MESKRIQDTWKTIWRNTFNRTSMESKHLPTMTTHLSYVCLLIAPIWNRNLRFRTAVLDLYVLFNRTSMESKRSWCEGTGRNSRSFNRTSMESKLPLFVGGVSNLESFNQILPNPMKFANHQAPITIFFKSAPSAKSVKIRDLRRTRPNATCIQTDKNPVNPHNPANLGSDNV